MIRSYEKADLDDVMRLWLDTNIKAHHFIDRSYWQSNYEAVKEMMPQATVYVYVQGNAVQAFIGLMDDYIAGVFVSSEFQSKGIGKRLLDYTKATNNELSLRVYKRNDRAVDFYIREGFSVTAEQVDDNTGQTEFLMEWVTRE